MIEDIKIQRDHFIYSLKIALGIVVFCIVVHLIFIIIPTPKYYWSIYPRDLGQWYGIFTGHYIHASWGHLASNLPPLFVTVMMIFFFYRSIGWAVYSMIWVLTGFAVFMFARNSSHIGASGLVYGLIAFVFFSGIFRRNIKSVVLMVIMVIMYSGYTAGFIPTDEKVSWESHLFGAIAGLWTAFIFRNYREKDEVIKKPDWYNDHTNKEYYLPRDVFDKTIAEREEEERIKKEEELNSGFTTHSLW